MSQFASVFAFLSIVPINPSRASIYDAARNMHLFPIVGGIIGLGVGLLAYVVFEVVEPLFAGLLVSIVLLVITGLHHTDGLADMADGLMTRGTRKRKLDAMRDKTLGIAGVVAVVFSIAALIITLSLFTSYNVWFGILMAEVLAKFSMVVITAVGKPAYHNGTGSLFAKSIREDRRKLAASIIFTIIIIVVIILYASLSLSSVIVSFAVAVVIPVILAYVARCHFGGITGDVIGATNDIVRVAVLAVVISI